MNDVATTSNGTLVSFIERAAKDPEFDVGKFEALLRMHREIEQEQAKRAFNRSMAACQAEMTPVVRTAQNKHIGNKYAKLEAIDQQMRPIYTSHGFSIRFGSAPAPREGDMRIICTVAHDAGYSEENYLDAPLSTLGSQGGRMAITPVQAVGSNITYLRRYLSAMCFNMVMIDDDDDGEGSRKQPQQARPSRPAPRREEMDRTMKGDDIPEWDAPTPDPAKQYVEMLIRSLIGCVTIDDYNDIMANPAVGKNLNALREKRPELYEQCERARKAALDRLTYDADADAGQPA